MRGVNVVVIRRSEAGVDAHGNVVHTESTETVHNVSVRPESTSTERDRAARHDGEVNQLSLAFPKTYTESLKGCAIQVPCLYGDTRWEIQGNPLVTPFAPTAWNRNAKAVREDG